MRASLRWPALVLGAALAACSPVSENGSSDDVRREAVGFRLEQLGGGEVELADWSGKPVILDFWATWCPPCEYQVPELNALYQAHREANDVGIFGISIDEDGPEIVSEWVAEKGVDYPILLSDGDLARQYGAVGFPTFVLIAPDGRVDWTHAGVIDREDIESRLAKFIPTP
ncbi:MAG: TlpA disulfide reductase family protein [Myxococcota bacterium]|nr:TlpA disulfide reductase family protein [Myxococcota bacterium]